MPDVPKRSVARTLVTATRHLSPLPTARQDAEWLLSAATGLARTQLLARGGEVVEPSRLAAFEALVARRAAGEPLAYILGHTDFLGIELTVSPAVLVPRPETELLAEWAIARCAGRAGARVLDVGTGSGALAIAVAARVADVHVVATDISASACAVAAGNVERLGLAARVRVRRADLLPAEPGVFDLVVANLPYVGTAEADLDPAVRRYEPATALFAGPDGLALIRRLLARLPRCLAPDGAAGLEIGWRQGAAALALARQALPAARVTLRPDLAGLDRLLLVERAP